MNIENEVQNQADGKVKTIREMWLEDFFSESDQKYFKDTFLYSISRIFDEYRAEGGSGVYNTSNKLVAKPNLSHLNVPAKSGDEYGQAAMERIRDAFQRYQKILSILGRVSVHYKGEIVGSVPLFAFLMRDALTTQSRRIVDDDPVIAALKLAHSPSQIARRFSRKTDYGAAYSAEDGISYIRKRMRARVSRELIEWCHMHLPEEAARLGLPKEAVNGEGASEVELVYSLEGLDMDVADFDLSYSLAELRGFIADIESLIEGGQVFYFGSDGVVEDGYYVLYETENGSYYQLHIRDWPLYADTASQDSILLEDKETIAAILDTGVSPFVLTEAEMKRCGLAA